MNTRRMCSHVRVLPLCVALACGGASTVTADAPITLHITCAPAALNTICVARPFYVVGDTLRLYAAYVTKAGTLADGPALTWIASPSSVATVDANGLVTIRGIGAATITVTGGGFTESMILQANPAPSLLTVTPPNPSIKKGQSVQFVAAVISSMPGITLLGFIGESPMQ